MNWTLVMFKDVAVGVRFSHSDYFFTKASETHATYSGGLIPFRPDVLVAIEVVV